MPIYEYQCVQCAEKFEVRQSIRETGSKLNCPTCHSSSLKRQISTFSVARGDTNALSNCGFPNCSSGLCNLPPM